MKVSLIAHTPNSELLVAVAAKTSFKSEPPTKILEKLSKKENVENIRKSILELLKHNHLSPIEHVSFTFAIEGISRACSHQLVRHRIASYTQQSQRYIKVDTSSDDWFVIPKTMDKENENLFKEKMRLIASWYNALINEKIPNEDARFILPNATKTNIIVTMNARELLHFFSLRLCARTQWELREVAIEMLKLVKKVAPTIFYNAGPSCMKGFCPEGDLMPKECRDRGILNIQKIFKDIK